MRWSIRDIQGDPDSNSRGKRRQCDGNIVDKMHLYSPNCSFPHLFIPQFKPPAWRYQAPRTARAPASTSRRLQRARRLAVASPPVTPLLSLRFCCGSASSQTRSLRSQCLIQPLSRPRSVSKDTRRLHPFWFTPQLSCRWNIRDLENSRPLIIDENHSQSNSAKAVQSSKFEMQNEAQNLHLILKAPGHQTPTSCWISKKKWKCHRCLIRLLKENLSKFRNVVCWVVYLNRISICPLCVVWVFRQQGHGVICLSFYTAI